MPLRTSLTHSILAFALASFLLVGAPLTGLAQDAVGTSGLGALQIGQDVSSSSDQALVIDTLYFSEPSGDGVLDAGEKGAINVELTNRLDTSIEAPVLRLAAVNPVQGIRLHTTDLDAEAGEDTLTFPLQGNIAGRGTATISVPVEAGQEVPGQDIQFEAVVEAESLRTAPGTIAFSSQPPEASLSIADAGAAGQQEAAEAGGQEAASDDTSGIAIRNRPEGASGEETESGSTEILVDQDIPEGAVSRPNAVAVVLGVSDYEEQDVPDVRWATRDAETVREYLVQTLGFREGNIIYEENPTKSAFERIFGTESNPQGQLHNYLRQGESEVFVYYSGHGAPDPESGTAYFVPADANPQYLSLNGYPVNQMYENLARLPAESVTVVLDACFSGFSQAGALIQGISPALLQVENPVMSLDNGVVFTASQASQVSTWFNEKQHGLFTYYFLKGLRGEADADQNREIQAIELYDYLTENVPYQARRLHGREQNPQLIGRDSSRVLVEYRAN